MKQVNVKKLLILNLPYLLFVWLFDKAAQAVRLSPGADLSVMHSHILRHIPSSE